jgi:hypothetical protein
MKMKAKKRAVREKMEEAQRVAKLLADAEKMKEIAKARLRGSRNMVSGEAISSRAVGRRTFSLGAATGGERRQESDVEMGGAVVQNGTTR